MYKIQSYHKVNYKDVKRFMFLDVLSEGEVKIIKLKHQSSGYDDDEFVDFYQYENEKKIRYHSYKELIEIINKIKQYAIN